MVSLTKDWDGFQQYAENCRVGSFQVKLDVDGKEVRVKAGQFGFIKVYDTENEDDVIEFDRVKRFCKLKGFIEVYDSITDELFYT